MGPLDVFLGWQPILLAVLVYMATQLIKTALDLAQSPPGVVAAKLPAGRRTRRESRFLTRIVLPALPPVVGGLLALVLPLPDSLATYTATAPLWLALVAKAAWGAACGQFADYLYSKLKGLVRHERGGGR